MSLNITYLFLQIIYLFILPTGNVFSHVDISHVYDTQKALLTTVVWVNLRS